MESVQGVYFDGRTADGVEVTAFRRGDHLVVVGDRIEKAFPLRAVRVAPVIGNVPAFVALPDGGQLQAPWDARLSHVLAGAKPREGLPDRLERLWGVALLAIGIVAGIAVLGYTRGLPWAAEKAAQALPPGIERTIGDQAMVALDGQMMSPSQLPPARQEQIAARFRRVAAGADPAVDYRLEFRSSAMIGPNAFALPGGVIVLLDQLVNFAGNDERVLAVLAHELGHVRHRHAMRSLLQESGAALLVATIAGEALSVSTIVAGIPTVLLTSRYSRGFETEADDFAFALLATGQISPERFAEIMEKFRGEEGSQSRVSGWISTHPLTDERIARARAATGRR